MGEAVREPRYVIIDELHAYRGVFESPGNVLRRLRRIAGTEPDVPLLVNT
jgi:ATP-dependent helicase YprA (DUF1998 family)